MSHPAAHTYPLPLSGGPGMLRLGWTAGQSTEHWAFHLEEEAPQAALGAARCLTSTLPRAPNSSLKETPKGSAGSPHGPSETRMLLLLCP